MEGIYAMWDKTHNIAKIGRVEEDGTQQARADHLRLELIEQLGVESGRSSEGKLHERYSKYRIPVSEAPAGMTEGKTEMFKMNRAQAIYAIRTISGEHATRGVSPFALEFIENLDYNQGQMFPTESLRREQFGRGVDYHKERIAPLMAEIKADNKKIHKPLLVALIAGNYVILSGNHRHICAINLIIEEVPVIIVAGKHFTEKDLLDIARLSNKDNKSEIPVLEVDIHEILVSDMQKTRDFFNCTEVEAYKKIYEEGQDYDVEFGRYIGYTRSVLSQSLMKNARLEEDAIKSDWRLITKHNKSEWKAQLDSLFPEEGHHVQLEGTANWRQGLGRCVSELFEENISKSTLCIHRPSKIENVEHIEKVISGLRDLGLNIFMHTLDQNIDKSI